MGKSKKTAIDAKRGTYFLMDPDNLTIVEDPSHPLYDPRGLEPPDEDLVASIRLHGVDKAVKAIKDGGDILVVDGRRRTVAAREAKKLNRKEGGPAPMVKVELVNGDDRSAVTRMILGNFRPKDESVMEKAGKALVLANLNIPHDEIGAAFGVSAGTIKNWLAALSLHPTVQKALDAGRVRLLDATRELGKLPRAEQPEALKKLEEVAPTRAVRAEQKKNGKAPAKPKATPASRLGKLSKFTLQKVVMLGVRESLLLDWIWGQATDGDLVKIFPELAPMVER